MAITSAVCTSFKVELLKGVHNFTASTGNTFNLALYTSDATLGASTTAYTTSNEISGSGYTAKGHLQVLLQRYLQQQFVILTQVLHLLLSQQRMFNF